MKKQISKFKKIIESREVKKCKQIPNKNDLIFPCPVEECNKRYQRNCILLTHIRIKHKNIYRIPKLKNGRRNYLTNQVVDYNLYKFNDII